MSVFVCGPWECVDPQSERNEGSSVISHEAQVLQSGTFRCTRAMQTVSFPTIPYRTRPCHTTQDQVIQDQTRSYKTTNSSMSDIKTSITLAEVLLEVLTGLQRFSLKGPSWRSL